MTILHIVTTIDGGAGRSAHRLHEGLLRVGVDSRMIVLRSTNLSDRVFQLPLGRDLVSRCRRWFLRKRQVYRRRAVIRAPQPLFEQFSIDSSPVSHELLREIPEDTIINLHWVADFVDYTAFFAGLKERKIVWTLHDMNPFTGGCHFDNNCGRYTVRCGKCPQLGSDDDNDLSSRVLARKNAALRSIGATNLVLVSPSRWLKAESERSSLFSGKSCLHIPYGVDTEKFCPIEKATARESLGLPKDAFIVLFVAAFLNSPRKGASHLLEAFKLLPKIDGLFFLSIGSGAPIDYNGVAFKNLGVVNDDMTMRIAYSAADIFAISSVADNLPNTLMESLSCGTPAVGYPVGGIPDILIHRRTGLLAENLNPTSLASSIVELLMDYSLRRACGKAARQLMLDCYTMENQALRYAELYSSICPAPTES